MTTTHELFNVRAPSDALNMLLEQLPARGATEEVATRDALDRVLAEDITSPSDLPTFRRSTMDGFAVRAADTFGATEGLPAYLELVDEVFMGQAPNVALGAPFDWGDGNTITLPNGNPAPDPGIGIYGASYSAAGGIYKNLGYSSLGYDGRDNNGNGLVDELLEGTTEVASGDSVGFLSYADLVG